MSGRFLSSQYTERINQRVEAGDEPWAGAYAQLIADADEALDAKPRSVREAGTGRFFRVDGVYVEGRDGVVNTEANMVANNLLRLTARTCHTLALAWRFSDDARYAAKALELIHHWCINRNTYMEPTGMVMGSATPGFEENGDISLFGGCGRLFLAAYLLGDYSGWDLYAQASVRRWVRGMIEPQRELMFFEGRQMYNNWEEARLIYLATGALCVGDMDLLIDVFERWKQLTPLKMTAEGELHRETMRTRSMHYTLFALYSGTLLAEIAGQHGVDLYDYNTGGKCQKLAIDYAAKYLLDMDSWPFEMLSPLSTDRIDKNNAWLALFELAHGHWGDRLYLDVINAYGGRPVPVSHATLLYAKS